jgi:hypothetical protein
MAMRNTEPCSRKNKIFKLEKVSEVSHEVEKKENSQRNAYMYKHVTNVQGYRGAQFALKCTNSAAQLRNIFCTPYDGLTFDCARLY